MASEKDLRQTLICQLIRENKVPNQKTLIELLQRNGIAVTQATVSRDLEELGVQKEKNSPEDSYPYYHLPILSISNTNKIARRIIGTRGYKSIQYTSTFSVIKTEAGYAHSICTDIDALDNPAIIGTIAGDDTILVLHSENIPLIDVKNAIGEVIPEIFD